MIGFKSNAQSSDRHAFEQTVRLDTVHHRPATSEADQRDPDRRTIPSRQVLAEATEGAEERAYELAEKVPDERPQEEGDPEEDPGRQAGSGEHLVIVD